MDPLAPEIREKYMISYGRKSIQRRDAGDNHKTSRPDEATSTIEGVID